MNVRIRHVLTPTVTSLLMCALVYFWRVFSWLASGTRCLVDAPQNYIDLEMHSAGSI